MYTSKEIYKKLKEKGFSKMSDKVVTGEEYEEWKNERFKKEVDKNNKNKK